MSSKRKSEPVKKPAKRKSKKQEEDSDEFSDEYEDKPEEVPQIFEELPLSTEPLPADVIETIEKPPGKLLVAGQVTWDMCGKRDPKGITKVRPNLYSFQRFTDETYRFVTSGCIAGHNVLINMDKKALTFGRNPNGQLGQPELKCYETPTLVPELEDLNIISAACGRHHTLFLTETGQVYACGENKSGQCGLGNTTPVIQKATRIKYNGPPIVKVACGGEFSAILDIKGNLYTFGLPEYGQLGHNTDGKYFVTSTKLSYHFETTPKKVVLYIEKSKDGHVTPLEDVKIVDFACGANHTVAIDSKKRAYSWGWGGFGRLGHAEQKDEKVPRLIKYFETVKGGVRRVFCGSAYSLAISDLSGQLYLFGKIKNTGEANMYPKPVQDLSGWNITDIGTSLTSTMIVADDSLIAWGASPTYGELGLGDLMKSSTTPKEVNKLEGMKITQVTMGNSHTLMLCNTEDATAKEKYEKLPEFELE